MESGVLNQASKNSTKYFTPGLMNLPNVKFHFRRNNTKALHEFDAFE